MALGEVLFIFLVKVLNQSWERKHKLKNLFRKRQFEHLLFSLIVLLQVVLNLWLACCEISGIF